jgi:hypothetical protein
MDIANCTKDKICQNFAKKSLYLIIFLKLSRPRRVEFARLKRGEWKQGWAKLFLIALERYSVALKRLTFNLR